MAQPTPAPAVELDEVSVDFGGRLALDRVTVTVKPGELVAVVGRSGAGKTTLLRCLGRVLAPAAGTIRVGGHDLSALHGRGLRAYRARVGVIYQQFNLVRRLSVLDNPRRTCESPSGWLLHRVCARLPGRSLVVVTSSDSAERRSLLDA